VRLVVRRASVAFWRERWKKSSKVVDFCFTTPPPSHVGRTLLRHDTVLTMSNSSTAHEVHLAIYDLSMGMARNLSAQFLGPQHAVEIIPHTAILAFGKEYYFGQGIDWCSPHEFRSARGIHPIDIHSLGHTTCTEGEFESWCRAQSASRFGADSYDLFRRNCNNFSEEAARHGLRLPNGVPRWILDLPQKVLSSPMGVILRPILDQMQITNNAPTNLPTGGNAGPMNASRPTYAHGPSSTATSTSRADNPWAGIPAPSSPARRTTDATSSKAAIAKPVTPIIDGQTALLSTDTGVVKICIDRLKPNEDHAHLLFKLTKAKSSWTLEEITSVHEYLRSVINCDAQHASYALMLMRLIVLKRGMGAGGVGAIDTCTRSIQHVAKLLLEDKLSSIASRSMAWCVLGNAIGSIESPDLIVFADSDDHNLMQIVDKALHDCGSLKDTSTIPLRQSAGAFLYNASRYLTSEGVSNGEVENDGGAELSEEEMAILLGCLENLQDEIDSTSMQRLLMATGELLKSHRFGKTAANLVNDLGLLDENIGNGKGLHVEALVKEVTAMLR
jgi:hypothetical protein